MSEARKQRIATWVITVAFSLLAVGAFVAPAVFAQDAVPSAPVDTWRPFELYPAGPGATPYEQQSDVPAQAVPPGTSGPISAAEQAAASRVPKALANGQQAWVESSNGFAVSQAWSQYTSISVEQAQVKAAEYAAGLAGVENAGVVP